MDNERVDVSSEGKENFTLTMKLIAGKNKTVGYDLKEGKLILYWAKHDKMIPLPYEMDINETIEFAWGYIQKNKPVIKEPPHDGSNNKGFHVYNEAWGHVDGRWKAYAAIEVIWAMYGK